MHGQGQNSRRRWSALIGFAALAACGGDSVELNVKPGFVGNVVTTAYDGVADDLPAQLVQGALGISGLYDLEPLRHAPFIQADLKLTPAAQLLASGPEAGDRGLSGGNARDAQKFMSSIKRSPTACSTLRFYLIW